MGLHTPLHVCNLFLNPHDDTMFYGWCDFFFSLILKIMLFMSHADMHTHSEEQVNEIDLRVCLRRRLATKTRWSSASSVFIFSCLFCLAHLICWLHRCFITSQKNNNSTQSISLCATLETFCYWAARSYKPWWLHSMWENFLVNSPNGFLNALNH